MAATRAERGAALEFEPASATAPRPADGLGRRQLAELAAPGATIGLASGLIVGGMAVGSGLSAAIVVVAALALGVPLAVGGGAYELLLAYGRLRLGALAPGVVMWVVAFPVARAIHEVVVDLAMGVPVAPPDGWAGFLAFQAIVSVGFAIGFWWLHENFVPRWWFHIRQRNPVADHFVRHQLTYAAAAEAEKERRAAHSKARRR